MKKEKIVIVGGGLVGCSAAYFLAQKGYQVTILEQQEIAYGASGRNPGYVLYHTRKAGTALNLAKAGMNIYPQLVEELGDCFEFRQNGCLIYYYTDEQQRVLQEFVHNRNRDGVPMEILDRSQIRQAAPILPETVLGASYCPMDGQIRTPLLVKRLAEVASDRYGVNIVTGVEVTDLITTGTKVNGVKTSQGDYYADIVVLATGAWAPLLGKQLNIELPVYPERLQVLETEPVPIPLRQIVYGPTAVKHYSLIKECPSYKPEYFEIPEEKKYGLDLVELVCQTASGSLLVGCPIDYPGLTSQNPTMDGIQLMIDNFQQQFTHLKPITVNRVWGGWLPFTADGLPIIDWVDQYEGLIAGVGHIFGNIAGPLTGQLIAEMIEGNPLPLDLSECRYNRIHPSLEEANW
jgi:glycine/D-amino acid oxidase-like deaminating enzyme